MAKQIGRLAKVYVGRESSRGTGAAATFFLPKASISHDLRVVKANSGLGYATIGEGNQELVAGRYAQGTIEGDVLDRSFGLLLYAALGSLSTAGPTDSAYTHTFSLSESNQHPSLSLYRNDENSDQLFELSMLSSLQLTTTPDQVVQYVAEFMSKEPQDSVDQGDAPQNVSIIAENKFLGRHATIKVGDATGDLAAASAIPVKSLTLTINKNVILDWVVGTVLPEDILNQKFEVTGEIELFYQNETYRNLIKNGSYQALRVQLTNTDATIGGGSTNPSLTLDLSRVAFAEWESAFPNDEVATQRFTFRALYDVTNANIVNDCALVNAEDGSNY